MKGLTILQPYAAMICLPDTDPRAKRVENRDWKTYYRGELLIHAGKSTARIDERPDFDLVIEPEAFGAVVAIARLVECFRLIDRHSLSVHARIPNVARARHPWLASHPHVEGPWCWVLADVRPLPAPVPWRGAQGLWDVPAELREEVRERRQREGGES